jgi:hypothetical protein
MMDTIPGMSDRSRRWRAHRAIVDEMYGTLDWLRDSRRDEHPESFKSALKELRDLLTQLDFGAAFRRWSTPGLRSSPIQENCANSVLDEPNAILQPITDAFELPTRTAFLRYTPARTVFAVCVTVSRKVRSSIKVNRCPESGRTDSSSSRRVS